MISFTLPLPELFYFFLTMGLIFLVAGGLLFKYPPKHRNIWYGYRTTASLKSPERWKFAQVECGKSMVYLGGIHFILAGLAIIFKIPTQFDIPIGIMLSLILAISMIAKVESAIRKKFPIP